MKLTPSRRTFLAAAAPACAAAQAVANPKPALLGGPKTRTTPFPDWPVADAREERALLDTLHSGKWFRGSGQNVKRFEEAYAQLTGARQALATANGTAALFISLNVLGVEPGDEVIVPPYTFIATVNVVLRQHALPVFVDTDPESFQIDHRLVERAITPNTRAIMPVHLGGNVCQLDSLLATAAKHKIPLIEDACQAHLAEWRGRKVGTLGATGCFSFQASKNLNSGEGGAILFQDEDLRERAYAFHNNGSGLRMIGSNFSYASSGANLRLAEWQGAILLAQMTRLQAQAKTRSENGAYLTSLLKQIPGLSPAIHYEGTTNNAFHLYMFRYNSEAFSGLSRDQFLKALAAEGIPGASGYRPLNTQQFIKDSLASRGFQRLFSAQRLKQWAEQNQCPANDKLCTQAVWFTQNMLLGPKSDMDQIAGAIQKIKRNAAALAKS
ncbi:MAG: aminotransferase class I/II-fold pyridoxal phosphate-dependent enzyme [Acidobacteria bacterium]|nr:aminotransferase class I/II-fold pyridoxal phosphate-dependent enzyme [Acidobacteriota bacterium]